ncbi:MAG: heme o synthase [Candidatus Neptunochlamydia sp.]|nr:heme o synthase [Candidatus Neptunochlamydia sp.]
MEKIAKFNLTNHLKNFLVVIKPGIIIGNVLTAVGGFTLAAKGVFDSWLFIAMLEGLSFIIASACVFNNVIDRELDKKMTRTQNRPLPKGAISPKVALIFAFLLGIMGVLILGLYTNLLTLIIALTGLVIYVFIYSFSKYKTSYGTLIGSIAGAVPPVVGYTAVSQRVDLAAIILFVMIALWQMPHFYAIAIFRLEDYQKGSIPVLPLKRGILATKIQMVFYCLAFMMVSTLLAFFDYAAGPLYFVVMSLFGLAWLILSIQGLTCKSDQEWARKMFFFSLVIVIALCTLISFNG